MSAETCTKTDELFLKHVKQQFRGVSPDIAGCKGDDVQCEGRDENDGTGDTLVKAPGPVIRGRYAVRRIHL